MKAFLLAAGRGTRISKNIPAVPKCTLDVDGEPLVLKTVNMLLDNDIEPTIVVGYKHNIIEKILEAKPVNFVYNPFFDVTNSIASLWLAEKFFDKSQDTIIANADVFWSQDILDLITQNNDQAIMLSDYKRADDGDYFFLIDQENHIQKYGKELSRENRNCEYVGIGRIKSDFVPVFLDRLNEMIDEQQHDVWWENVLYSLIGAEDVYALDVAERFWAEIDFIEDYHRILDFLKTGD